ncbi:MAG: hypothetical protein IJ279_04725 [Clostridia bacterium]|nr:hypothetical protein [Clostridia bacterium]
MYKSWMSYLKDDVKIIDVVMPSAHNACSYDLKFMGCCQNGNMYKQYEYGIRHFCIRLDTNKNGEIVVCHGITKGGPFVNDLRAMKKMLEENDSEFFIFDIREYYPQKIGPFTINFKADVNQMNELLEEYIKPSELAFCDFDDINNVTVGDIRKSGKRYILYNFEKAYDYSVNCEYDFPWDKRINGLKAEGFAKEVVKLFDLGKATGLNWFQIQQTPNLGTEIGIALPRKLDEKLRPYFPDIIKAVESNPEYLKRANIIASDFMTEDYMKSELILKLNCAKNNIQDNLKEEFIKNLEEK